MRRFESYYLCQVRHRRCAGCGDAIGRIARSTIPIMVVADEPRIGKRHSDKTLKRVVDDGKRKAYYRREGKMLYLNVWHRQVSAGGSGRKTITVLYIFSTKNAKYALHFRQVHRAGQTTYFYR